MRHPLWRLFVVEFRRMWPTVALFIPPVLAAMSTMILFFNARNRPVYDVLRWATQVMMGFAVPFSAVLFCSGIVAQDVKDGWLRTLLIRPVTRQQYLLVKIAAAFASVSISIVISGVLPNIVMAMFATGKVEFSLGTLLVAHLLFFLQALLLISMLVLFSCWLPGMFNIVLVALWYIAASMLGAYLQVVHWTSQWLTLLREYLFPSGFSNAMDMITSQTGTPLAELAWGLGATGAIIALAFWSITRIQVDKSSE